MFFSHAGLAIASDLKENIHRSTAEVTTGQENTTVCSDKRRKKRSIKGDRVGIAGPLRPGGIDDSEYELVNNLQNPY